ncbi:DUF2303 family protein [Roseimaritima ulvae]|uniref:Uncharacterized protein n=1 Tax=Roseimaritima ulvae TaxID=980254 RepID=A0A5B9QNB0_9BACT|nr:DUF2303 family protein [Roseimaritima ulvae]QEG40454.1 hypothetical protein UC8_24660 [Roseimaritima ulvae]
MDDSRVSDLLRQLREGNETVMDVCNFTDADGKDAQRMTFGTRKLQPELPTEKKVARAQARSHVFNDLDAFAAYLIREAEQEQSVILADVESRTIGAVLNEADEYDREIVTLQAVEHPLFTPWARLFGHAIPVLEFALFVMKYRRAVVEPDGRELAMIFSQVKASKEITIQQGVGKKSINGMMVQLDIAGERQGMPVELPEVITLRLPLFVGTPNQPIQIDVLVTDGRDGIVVYLTAADVEQQRIEAFERMVDRLKQETGLLVGMGTIQQRDWELVR